MFPNNNVAPQNYYTPQPAYPVVTGQQMLPTNAAYTQQQQPKPVNQMKSLSGRIVSNDAEITPNEVVMDGSVSFFPQADYSCIFAKQWGQDGTIQTVRYIPDVPNVEEASDSEKETIADSFSAIFERLDNIEGLIKKNNKLNTGFASVQREIADQFCQLKMEQKDAQIAEQQNLINALNLAQSQANQNQYLISQLRPCPTPAYLTCNPWATNGTSYNGCCGAPTCC